LEYLLFEVLTH
jgi:hypothetical protein